MLNADNEDPVTDIQERTTQYIDKLATFNHDLPRFEGGINRLAFTTAESEAINWAKEKLSEYGYECEYDPFLNLHARDPRKSTDRFIVGTHLDSVLNGGKYDGTVGFVTFLLTLKQAVEEDEDFKYPVDFVIFRAEESTIFKEALLGSKVATGLYDLSDLMDKVYKPVEEIEWAYRELYEEVPRLENTDWNPIDMVYAHSNGDAQVSRIEEDCWFFKDAEGGPFKDYKAYFEVHIEQGKVLDMKEVDIGIVTSIRAPLRKMVKLKGSRDHSGATPMGKKYRQDALCAAGQCIYTIEGICEEESEKAVDIVGTVGVINVPGKGINVIPGESSFTIDLRSNDADERTRIFQIIKEECTSICDERGVNIEFEKSLEESDPVSLLSSAPEGFFEGIEKCIDELGISHMRMASGAGHDAMRMAQKDIPVCLLFIPCKDGISHSPDEYASADDISNAVKILKHIFIKGF